VFGKEAVKVQARDRGEGRDCSGIVEDIKHSDKPCIFAIYTTTILFLFLMSLGDVICANNPGTHDDGGRRE